MQNILGVETILQEIALGVGWVDTPPIVDENVEDTQNDH